jgi:ribose 5-phosphate isomerase A
LTERSTSSEASPREETDRLAIAGVEAIQSGMLVGLGTGRTANRAIRALARRVREERLDIDCVCSSLATEAVARELGLPIVSFDEVESLDYAFDGADEVDYRLRMIKGHHGAITRQRLVAAVASRFVCLATEDKLVNHLGKRSSLAITVIPFGLASTRNRLRDLGLCGVLRRTLDGELFVTDGGGVIFDMRIPETADIEVLAAALDHVPGVVDHGLFLNEAHEALIECSNGEIRRIVRASASSAEQG